MKAQFSGFLAGWAAGVMLVVASTWTLGYTAAITLPAALADSIYNGGVAGAALHYAWNILVIYGLGAGLMAAALTYGLIKWLPWPQRWKIAGIAAGSVIILYAAFPATLLSANPDYHLYPVTVVTCILLTCFFLRKSQTR